MKNEVVLTDNQVVDFHCHPFHPLKETEEFEQYFTLSMLHVDRLDMRNTLLFKMVIAELGQFFGINDPDDTDTVLEKRNREYKASPSEYISRLFVKAGIDTLILDIGFPSEEFTGYSIKIEDFKTLVPNVKLDVVVRVEPILNKLLGEGLSFQEFVNKYVQVINHDIDYHKAVSVKSIIAYLTGLEIEKVVDSKAKSGYEKVCKNQASFEDEKAFRDYITWKTMDICIERNLPFHLHTGMGDSPVFDLRLSNPLSLYSVISDEQYQKCKIVLIHAGYPYTAEAGYLANNYPNVWIDVSEMNPFASIAVEPKLLELMEKAPLTKILYGSDGIMIPEIYWFAAVHFKRTLGRVLSKLVNDGVITKKYAFEAARLILSENARRLLKLDAHT